MMQGNSAAAAEPAADQPTEIQGTVPVLKRALETNDRLELVANTLMLQDNMKQFGYMLGVTDKGRARKNSGKCIESFVKFLNNTKPQHPVLAGYFIGDDAMAAWIKNIRKIAQDESKRRKDNAENLKRDILAEQFLFLYMSLHVMI